MKIEDCQDLDCQDWKKILALLKKRRRNLLCERTKMSDKLRIKTIDTVEDPFKNDSITNMPGWWKWGVQVLIGLTIFPIRIIVLFFIVFPLTFLTLIPYSTCCDSCFGNKKKK